MYARASSFFLKIPLSYQIGLNLDSTEMKNFVGFLLGSDFVILLAYALLASVLLKDG